MKKIAVLCLSAVVLISCEKKRECLKESSEDVWLIVQDSLGMNLLESSYLVPAVGFSGVDQSTVGHRLEFIRDEVEGGMMAWKIDLGEVRSGRLYHMEYGRDDNWKSAEFELEWVFKDADCSKYKDYQGRELNWFRFGDSTYYEAGIHIYTE